MPYTRARWWLPLLFPAILFAFWPHYFGMMRQAPLSLHVHGLAATCWLLLLTAQAWTAPAGRRGLHRTLGRLTFVVVPAFAAGSAMAMRDAAVLGIAGADPFHKAFATRLVLADLIALVTFLALVGTALAQRRRVWAHGAAMLSTALLVLPPIAARAIQLVPGFDAVERTGMDMFTASFILTQAGAALAALWLAQASPCGAGPFRLTAWSALAQTVLFLTVARSAAWTAVCVVWSRVPLADAAAAGIAAAAIVLALSWRAGRRPVPATRPAAAARA